MALEHTGCRRGQRSDAKGWGKEVFQASPRDHRGLRPLNGDRGARVQGSGFSLRGQVHAFTGFSLGKESKGLVGVSRYDGEETMGQEWGLWGEGGF